MPMTARYRVDLDGYMRVCDQNYSRLLKLIPALESGRKAPDSGASWEFPIARSAMRVRISLLESFPYTTTLLISTQNGFPAWHAGLTSPVIEVRMYHDAATAEPVSYQGHRRIPARSDVPNADMYHQDEKRQVNEFLAEWLQLCLVSGVGIRSSDILCID